MLRIAAPAPASETAPTALSSSTISRRGMFVCAALSVAILVPPAGASGAALVCAHHRVSALASEPPLRATAGPTLRGMRPIAFGPVARLPLDLARSFPHVCRSGRENMNDRYLRDFV